MKKEELHHLAMTAIRTVIISMTTARQGQGSDLDAIGKEKIDDATKCRMVDICIRNSCLCYLVGFNASASLPIDKLTPDDFGELSKEINNIIVSLYSKAATITQFGIDLNFDGTRN